MQQINWHLGQAVLPEHFTLSQQLSNIRNIALSEVNSNTDFYGLAELKIDEDLFDKNIFRIESMLYITLTSECIRYKRTSHPNTLEINLNMLDTDKIDIIYSIKDKPLIEYVDIGENKIQTKLPDINLVEDHENNDLQSFRIISLIKKEDGKWVVGNFLPPLLSTRVYGFNVVLAKLSSLLYTIRSYVKNEKAINSAISLVKLSFLNNILHSCNQLQYCIWQLVYTKHSPVSVFMIVQQIYLHLLQYQESNELDSELVYIHEKPLESFEKLILAISEKVMHTKAVEYKVFKPIDDLLSTGIIDFEALNRKKHYLVVRKPVEDYSYSLSLIKLTAPSRAEHIYKYAMVGMKLSKLDFNPLPASSIDKYCDIYEILPSREWDYILSEQVMCLLNNKEISGLKFVYYYV